MAPSVSGIQDTLLEVTVVGCSNLLDTEWISKQDPYVCVEYATTKFRTRTCTDGHKNPTFQEKYVISLIEGLRKLNVLVWNSNTITYDDLIGSGRVQLQRVLTQGFDDSPWPLHTKNGRHAGDVRLTMHYANASAKSAKGVVPSAPLYTAPAAPLIPPPYMIPVSPHLTHAAPAAPHVAPYAGTPAAAPFAPPETYPAAAPHPSYPAHPTTFPKPTIAYNPHPYPLQYFFAPPPQAAPHYPPGTYPGAYPPTN